MSDATSSNSIVADDAIDIAVPLRAEHAATLRVIVSSLGSDNGLNVDEIDDLKLAVSEVFTLLVDDRERVGATRAHIRYEVDEGDIRVHLHRGLTDDHIELDVLATTILSSVVDDHVVTATGISLTKLGAGHA